MRNAGLEETQAGIKTAGRNINTLRYIFEISYLSVASFAIIFSHSEGDLPWDFFGRTDAIAETPVLWPPHAKT